MVDGMVVNKSVVLVEVLVMNFMNRLEMYYIQVLYLNLVQELQIQDVVEMRILLKAFRRQQVVPELL